MTNASTGAAVRLHVLPTLPQPLLEDGDGLTAAAPVASTRSRAQVDALDTFVRSFTSSGGSADGVQLRLLYGELHPDDRPLALQLLTPFRETTREQLVQVATTRLDQDVDELRRQYVRLQEIGTTSDATDPTATPQSSAAALQEFGRVLELATVLDGVAPRLRAAFTRMTPGDRRVAQSQLAQVRSDELRRTQQIRTSENGEVDPSEYLTLRRLSAVDAPVEAWEVPQPPGATSYSFAAGM